MAERKLTDADYRTPEVVMRRERVARTQRDSEVGQGYLCYEMFAPGANPYLYVAGTGGDAQARYQHRWGQTGAQAAEIARVFTSQPQASLGRLVDRIMSEVFPEGSDWADLQPGDDYDEQTAPTPDEAAERKEAHEENAVMLQPIQRRVFQDLHRSNFAEEAPMAVMDAAIWRVGVLRVKALGAGEGASALAVEHVPQSDCSFEWGPTGDCWGVYRQHYFTREECEYYWPNGAGWQFDQDDGSAEAEDPRQTFIEATYRVPGKTVWAYQVIQVRDTSGREVMKSEFPRNPYIVFGLNGKPGGVLTRSIAELALATARSLNTMTRITMEAAEFRATPAYTVEQGGITNSAHLKYLEPRMLVPVKSNARDQPSLSPLAVAGDVDLGWSSEERMSQQVQQLCKDQALPPDRPQPKSATEVLEIVREFKNTMGPIYSRLMRRLGVPVLQHFLDALYELKEVKGMNREGGDAASIELDGRQVKVTFVNPLAQAQRMSDVEGASGWLEMLRALLPEPVLAASVNLEAFPEWSGKKLRVPSELWRKPEQREELAPQAIQTQITGAGQPGAGGERPAAGTASMFGTPPMAA